MMTSAGPCRLQVTRSRMCLRMGHVDRMCLRMGYVDRMCLRMGHVANTYMHSS